MRAKETVNMFWWLIQRDLTCEIRARHVWPGMLLLGIVLVLLLATQLDLPLEDKLRVGGGMLWLAIFFAGTVACERSFAGEREGGCWQTLRLYPIPPSVVYLAKLAVNFIALVVLEFVLTSVFVVLTDVSLSTHPFSLALVAALGNLGFAAVGTIVSGLTAGLRQRGSLLALILLPLVVPVVLGVAEATRMLLTEPLDPRWSQWMELLAVFDVVFTVLGVLVFEFVMEE